MADTSKSASASSPAAKKTKSAKNPGVKPSHPPTSDMVNTAIKSLNERGGSSLQAIKKYITANYKIDAEKLSPFIKKYLKSAVTVTGKLIQTKGKGANGSFKLSTVKSESTQKKALSPKKAKAASGTKNPMAKMTASPAKKQPAAKSGEQKKTAAPANTVKKSGSVKASKSPKQKSTKPKAAAKKPKTPKPKMAAPAKKVAAPKKATAPKKK